MKKLITAGLLALFGIESFALAGRDGFIIANRGESPSCAIVIGADAAEAEKCAAGELQTFVRRMTGVYKTFYENRVGCPLVRGKDC